LEVDEKETRKAFKIIVGGNTSPSTNRQDGPELAVECELFCCWAAEGGLEDAAAE
jgi:hypothetical protein